jgi:hypothetical protein
MAERGKGRSAAFRVLAGLAVLAGAFSAGCHKRLDRLDYGVEAPQVSYQTPVVLATAGEPYTSVAPEFGAYVKNSGVGTFVTTGITFTVVPDLPAGLTLNPTTGIISGTPLAATPAGPYTITASNIGGSGSFSLTLGVQDASPVAVSYAQTGLDAAAGAVGATLVLNPPTVTGDTATGFGVAPALPVGLTLNPSTGLVSGQPTAALAGTQYTLTATAPSGSGNCTFTLLVAAQAGIAPAGLNYPPISATLQQPFVGPLPSLAAGTDVVYTVLPALPAGLVLDPLTGQVTGTPTASAQITCQVTASNAVGSTGADVAVTVN